MSLNLKLIYFSVEPLYECAKATHPHPHHNRDHHPTALEAACADHHAVPTLPIAHTNPSGTVIVPVLHMSYMKLGEIEEFVEGCR